MEHIFFRKGRPIWRKGKEREKNETAGFICTFHHSAGEEVQISIAASSIYRVFLNGVFLGHGPARAAHGYYRVDEIPVEQSLLRPENILAVEVVSFYVNSFYTLRQPGFLQAEIKTGDRVAAYTGAGGGFRVASLNERIKKVQRYSFQRPFIEAYRVDESYGKWRQDKGMKTEEWEETEEKQLLDRKTNWPVFPLRQAKKEELTGFFTFGHWEQPVWEDRSYQDIGAALHGYKKNELEIQVSRLLDSCKTTKIRREIHGEGNKGEFQLWDLGRNTTGFIGIFLECQTDTHIILVFDEISENHDLKYNRLGCVNGISLELKRGTYRLETIQPYTCRYIKPMIFSGKAEIREVFVREYKASPPAIGTFFCDEEPINRIFQAGVETFVQNTADIFMDCPSRERAGWLCDSFFMGRTEHMLTGGHAVEETFLENYALPDHFEDVPAGMVPMCYPADHWDGIFIANWALWLILEIYEYQERSAMTACMKRRVFEILEWHSRYENEDGFLENVPGWVFIEWSRANELTDGVNFPSNMLYAAALLAAGTLYHREEYIQKGRQLQKAIRKTAFDGTWFCDHAVRKNGALVRVSEATECCQYYAFFLQTADKKQFPDLWNRLCLSFGPRRTQTNAYPEIAPANAFIGEYLRMELLAREGLIRQLLDEMVLLFKRMAVQTGTLWENTTSHASCNHGFASHVVYTILHDVMGVKKLEADHAVLCFHELPLRHFTGRIPVRNGYLTIQYDKNTKKRLIHIPAGYTVEFASPCDCEVVYEK